MIYNCIYVQHQHQIKECEMVNLVAVDPSTIGTQNREGRRGRVSYPILKAFMESGQICVKIDPASTNKNQQYLRAVLTSYVKSHQLPVKLFSQSGELHLMRIDLDATGKIDPTWKPQNPDDMASEGAPGERFEMTPVLISNDEVDRRAQEDSKRSLE